MADQYDAYKLVNPFNGKPEQVAQVEPLSPVNDLVTTFAEQLATLDKSVTTFDDLAIQNENDTIALLLILAEID